MKQIIFLVVISVAMPAWAQADKPVAKEPAKPVAEQPPKQAAASPRKAGRRWNEDARHCLERASNTEIIKCAEEFL
jgi:hypothetical protein